MSRYWYLHKKYADDVGELYRQVLSVTSEYHDEVSIAFSGLPMLEVLPSGSGKHTGLSWLANSMSISQSEVIAFGDNLNDLTMLEWAGLGVAMGNGAAELFHYADQVTLTNDEDGVLIEKQLLEWISRTHRKIGFQLIRSKHYEYLERLSTKGGNVGKRITSEAVPVVMAPYLNPLYKTPISIDRGEGSYVWN